MVKMDESYASINSSEMELDKSGHALRQEKPAEAEVSWLKAQLLAVLYGVVATATASIIPDGAPQKMRRVVESSMLLYGLALVATAVIAQRGGLWTEAGKWLAQSYGGFIVFLFAFCLLSE